MADGRPAYASVVSDPVIQIRQLQGFLIRVPLKRRVAHASHTRTETHNLVVRCELSDGSLGWGEGVPRDYVTGETAASALQTLSHADYQPLAVPVSGFAEAVARFEPWPLPRPAGDDRNCATHAARCALELAYLDAFGRAFGEPLMTVARQLAPELVEPREQVRYSGVILSAKALKVRWLTLAQRAYGLEQLKIKVGILGIDDVQRLAVIRRWAGSKMRLRLDANEAWSPADCASNLRALEPFGIDSVEQPVPHEVVPELAAVRQQVRTPIYLDESLCSVEDAQAAVAGRLADGFNLRLSKCGGFIRTLRLAQFAQEHQLKIQLGCQVGETGILSAAGRQFASIVKGLTAVEGSYDRRLVRFALTQEDLTFGRGGFAPMLTGSGLGVTIQPTQIAPLVEQERMLYVA